MMELASVDYEKQTDMEYIIGRLINAYGEQMQNTFLKLNQKLDNTHGLWVCKMDYVDPEQVSMLITEYQALGHRYLNQNHLHVVQAIRELGSYIFTERSVLVLLMLMREAECDIRKQFTKREIRLVDSLVYDILLQLDYKFDGDCTLLSVHRPKTKKATLEIISR